MYFSIGIIRGKYRGVERGLLLEDLMDFEKRHSKNEQKHYLDLVKTYEEITGEKDNEESSQEVFEKILQLHTDLEKEGVPNEVIVYDLAPLDKTMLFGRNVVFLGIDLVCNINESLLKTEWERIPSSLLNPNALVQYIDDVSRVLPFCRSGNIRWSPCWVYEIMLV